METCGLDGNAIEFLKDGGRITVQWVRKLFNSYQKKEKPLVHFLLTRNRYKGERINYRGINSVGIMGRV